MSLEFKNASVTYQRLINKVFRQQIGRKIEVYVDNILVKSIQTEDLVTDLEEAFATLHKNRIKLNSSKCIFDIISGHSLSYLITEQGIEANSKKVQAL